MATHHESPSDAPVAKLSQPEADASSVRAQLQTIARIIATDRRPVALASETGAVLLANAAAQKIGIHRGLTDQITAWPTHCLNARRAGTQTIQPTLAGGPVDGELVHLPLGGTEAYVLRLSETDQESASLRNRARAATLLRVAHDLKTPIQSLLSTFEEWAEGVGDTAEQQADTARTDLRRTAHRALDQIDYVLGVIRSEQSPGAAQPDEAFCITGELQALIAMLRPIGRASETRIEYQPPAKDVWVTGPLRFVRALFQNMLDNSVKYGGAQVDVALRCLVASGEVKDAIEDSPELQIEFEVRDWGGGLPAAQKHRLLAALGLPHEAEAASAGASARRSSGLNILSHAIRQLGGTMEVLDRGENGEIADEAEATAVAGTILRAVFALPQARTPDPAVDGAVAPVCGKLGRQLQGHDIIVVEDSPASRDWLVQVLRRAGALVNAAENGHDALELLMARGASVSGPEGTENVAPSILLTDMTLPYMSGIEMVHKLRAAQDAGDTQWRGQIVGLTAHVDDRIRKACHDAGFFRILDKPIRTTSLLQALVEAGQVAQAASPAPGSVAASSSAGCLLSEEIVADLIEQIGPEGARNFMQRALAEARTIIESLQVDGAGPESRRLLHAATGACGLTGLTSAEKLLRAIEVRLEDGNGVDEEQLGAVAEVLTRTGQRIEQLS